MPYILEDLVIDRVDLVDEGANSAAFIELYKRKEQSKMNFDEILSKMKPEHAKVIQETLDTVTNDLTKAKEDLTTVTAERDNASQELAKAKDDLKAVNEDLTKAKSELKELSKSCGTDGKDDKGCGKACGKDDKGCGKACGKDDDDDKDCGKACGNDNKKANSGASFDEAEVVKGMPKEAREIFQKMQAQKNAAEEELRKAKEAEKDAKAIAKAKELKAIPVEQDKLVDILKRADADLIGVLETVNAAVEGVVLNEVGKGRSVESTDAWSRIEKKADEIVTRDSVTKAKAISTVITENPELYREYLQGGAN